MAALPDLITVAQFRQMPKDGTCSYELHHGEVLAVTRPRARHWKLQVRLTRLLESKLQKFGEVGMELPFRPVAEFELLAGDVAAIERQRFDRIDPDDNLRGAPELLIEIKSPSNTPARIRERVSLCLANGSLQCWIVDPDKKSVSVFQRDGAAVVYGIADAIPLTPFGSGDLAVSQIFE
ncbi:MAG: hypothetical protein C5B51_21220 [Terriglobia bacterium]|nr:MAG: hypothetical protein C5B51_21220 [Terriglobia bacterium]